MMWNGGFSREAMWGPPGDPAWARNDPTVQAGRLAANGTRLWIYCGNGTPTDPALASPDAPIGGLGFLEGMAIDSNHAFVDAYIAAGGNNGGIQFPRRHPQLGSRGPAAAADEARYPTDAWRVAHRPVSWWLVSAQRTLTEDISAAPDQVRDFYVDLNNIKRVHPLVVAVRSTGRDENAGRVRADLSGAGPDPVGAVHLTDKLCGAAAGAGGG